MSEILYVPDLARILGTTEASIRNHLQRETPGALPPGFKRGGKWAWYKKDVQRWLETRTKRPRGRPTKAEQVSRSALQDQPL